MHPRSLYGANRIYPGGIQKEEGIRVQASTAEPMADLGQSHQVTKRVRKRSSTALAIAVLLHWR